MTKLMEYFHTDWAAMTGNDWQGVLFTVAAVVAMIYVYVMVFNPKNKDAFEAQSDMALRDEGEHNKSGDKK
ncbi:MAG TPA: CcoQ/FixQ family Cbb3-type cytochrome c oxidase assembly chaperone [Gallionella sp.]|nr:CcoQ/FixQ family Cbb3-type cytochrome c oxidase assembly chaperone [Gallionella sp.]